MVKQIDVIIDKSYQWDFLKVAVLNGSMKGALTGSFRKALCW